MLLRLGTSGTTSGGRLMVPGIQKCIASAYANRSLFSVVQTIFVEVDSLSNNISNHLNIINILILNFFRLFYIICCISNGSSVSVTTLFGNLTFLFVFG